MMNENKIVNLAGIFDHVDDLVVRWLTALAMAANDLSLLTKLLKDYEGKPEASYFFRLSFGHLKEIAKVVGQAHNKDSIIKFLEEVDQRTRESYKELSEALSDFSERSLARSILSPIRNEAFHYPDIGSNRLFSNLVDQLKFNKKVEVSSSEDKTILGQRYLFADSVCGVGSEKYLTEERLKHISSIAVEVMVFVDASLDYLYRNNNEK